MHACDESVTRICFYTVVYKLCCYNTTDYTRPRRPKQKVRTIASNMTLVIKFFFQNEWKIQNHDLQCAAAPLQVVICLHFGKSCQVRAANFWAYKQRLLFHKILPVIKEMAIENSFLLPKTVNQSNMTSNVESAKRRRQ